MHEDAIHDWFAQLSEDERTVAQENLDRYLELAWEICEEIKGRASPD